MFTSLITRGATARCRYTLRELTAAEERWLHPSGHVLPVLVESIEINAPPYLQVPTCLEPSGEIPADVCRAVAGIADRRRRRSISVAVYVTLVVVLVGVAAFLSFCRTKPPTGQVLDRLQVTAPLIVPPVDESRIRFEPPGSTQDLRGVEIVSDERVVDLRGWKPFTPRQIDYRISPVTVTRRLVLRETEIVGDVRITLSPEGGSAVPKRQAGDVQAPL